MPPTATHASELAFFVRGTRMFPVGTNGPGAPLDEESASRGPALLEEGWGVAHVAQSGNGALVVLRAPGPRATSSHRLFFVHGVTAAPVEAPPADSETHVPDYALFTRLLERGWTVVSSVPSGTGALLVVRDATGAFARARRREPARPEESR